MNPLSLLRDYQLGGIKDLHRRWDAGATRVPLVLATGLGKTRMAVGITWEFLSGCSMSAVPEMIKVAEQRKRVLFLAHTDELIEQAAKAMRAGLPGVSVGIVKAGQNETHAQVIVSSRQTLASEKRRAQLSRIGLIIVDECHHALRTNTYGKILEHFGAFGGECSCVGVCGDRDDSPCWEGMHLSPSGSSGWGCTTCDGNGKADPLVKVVGLTATLVRGDKGKLSTVWEEVSFKRDILFGIRHGYLLDVRGVRVVVPDLDMSNVRQTAGDYRDGDIAEELERTFAPQIIAAKYAEVARTAAGTLRRGIVFWPLVETAYLGAEAFEVVGVPSAVVHGGLPKLERRLILKRFHEGEIRVIHNCAVLTEGFDEPSADVVVIARPTRSAGLYQQMVGRVLRPDLTVAASAREKALILDVVGAGAKHDLRSLVDLSPEHLAGRDYEDGESLLDLDEEWLLEEEERNKGGSILLEDELYAGDTEVKEFDPLGRDKLWSQTPGGTWFMTSGGTGYVFLAESFEGDPGTYDVVWASKDKHGPAALTQHRGLPLELALGWAEDEAIDRGGLGSQTLASRKSTWRKAEPSEAQQRLARRRGIWVDGMTRGECSTAIDMSYASERIDPLVNAVMRGQRG